MSQGEQPSRIETFLYDANGNRTEDGEVVELDAAGRVIARHAHDDLGWVVDPKSLEGDPGELATRPKHEES